MPGSWVTPSVTGVSSRLVAVSFDAHDPAGLAAFWGSLLGRELVQEAGGVLLPADNAQVGLRFVAASTEKTGQNRLHLHLTSTQVGEEPAMLRPRHSGVSRLRWRV